MMMKHGASGKPSITVTLWLVHPTQMMATSLVITAPQITMTSGLCDLIQPALLSGKNHLAVIRMILQKQWNKQVTEDSLPLVFLMRIVVMYQEIMAGAEIIGW